MVAIIVGTHGNLASELIRSSEMILGKRENIAAITLEPSESADYLVEKYKAAIQKLDAQAGVLFMTDLFGGSPYNAACKIAMERELVAVVTGVNLSMALETFNSQELSMEELIEVAERAGKDGVRTFQKSDVVRQEEEEL